jgi:LacI family transcriptional regulator
MGVRIVDIAKAAGVSPASVSLALNDRAGVADETRERIKSVARKLAYRGPRSAPAAAVSDTLCFLHVARHGQTINRDHDVFIADYIEGLGQGARAAQLNLEIVTFKKRPVEEIVRAARRTAAAGIVVLGTELTAAEVEAFALVRKPLVFLDTYYDFLPYDFVDMNNHDAVFAIVSHLHALGHSKIGMVTSAVETRNVKLREECFVKSLAHLGLPFEPRYLFSVGLTFHRAYEDMRALLRGGPKLPSALFCGNDTVACGCLRALVRHGVRVPDDVSLVGFDDLPLSAVVDPPLTTMEVSKAEIGRMAVHLLLTRIHSEAHAPPVKVLVGGRLVERESVKDLAHAKGAST